jgi:hypothetical protein
VWYSSDTIEWNKTPNAAGKEWYDETEVWNKSSGTTPMVNGKRSNITWSAKNTAKLVLIFTMYTGRVGAFTLLSLWVERPEPNAHFTEEAITIG